MTMLSRRAPAVPAPRASAARWLAAILAVAFTACGDGTGPGTKPTPDPQNPVPSIGSVDPDTLYQGGDSVTVTVTGTGFTNGAVVKLNGTARLTTYHNPSQVTAVVPAPMLQQTGTVSLTVFNPAPGGGESPAAALPVHFRAPVATELSPAAVLRGGGAFVLNVSGSGFSQGSVVRWNGQDRPTTYLGPNLVNAQIGEADIQAAGPASITVFTPAPGGGQSAALALPVLNRTPGMVMLNPSSVTEGHGAFTLTVSGMGFVPGATVRWNGQDRPTTFVNQGQLTAQIAAADVQAVGTATVSVFTPPPGGGTSSAITFMVTVRPNPLPVAAALSPNTLVAETRASFTLTGTGFMEASRVTVGGYQPAVTFVSANELRFALEPENVPNAGFASVYVTNPAPGGGSSSALSLAVTNPAPVLSSLSPALAGIGQDSQVVRLTGTGFVRTSEVRLDGMTYPARRISPTEMEIVLSAAHLRYPASFPITVVNYSPGGGVSGALPFSVQNPVPVAQAVVPAQAEAGQDSLVVRVTGSGFMPLSVVRFAGVARPTRRLSATELEAVLAAEDLDEAGTFALTVLTPAPGGGVSQPVNLVLTTPVPVLSLLPSQGASAGSPGFQLMVHGSGFTRASTVRWNGQPRATNYVSGTRLEANITGADLASPGTGSVTVHTPGGGTSAALQLTIRAVGPATLTTSLTVALAAQDLAYSSRDNVIYAALGATAGARANTVVAISPHTGEVTGSVSLGGNPSKLALSDDGTTLWVAMEGTGQVRRLALPGLTPGTAFSLGTERAEDMEVMPGRPGTVAIALRNQCCSPSHEGVAIYDDGVRRSQATPGHTGANQIVFGESASVLYGMSTAGGGFYTMAVGPGGVEMTRASGIQREGWTMEYGGGRVYTSLGGIVDGGRHELVGDVAFQAQGFALALDVATGRAFYARDAFQETTKIRVFDINTFQVLGEVTPGSGYIRRLIRWGTDGLALADETTIRILRMPIVAR